MSTTDPSTQAVNTVARRVLARIVAESADVGADWEDYADIGEYDWEAVVAEVRRLGERTDVQHEKYESAYRYLAGRAEGSPE